MLSYLRFYKWHFFTSLYKTEYFQKKYFMFLMSNFLHVLLFLLRGVGKNGRKYFTYQSFSPSISFIACSISSLVMSVVSSSMLIERNS